MDPSSSPDELTQGDRIARTGGDKPSWGRSTRRGIAWSAVAFLGSRGVNFISLLVIARLVTPSEFGVMAAILTFLSILELLSDLGMKSTVIRDAGRRHGYSERLVELSSTPVVHLEEGFEEYLSTLPSKSLLATLRKRRRRLERQGSLTLTVEDGATRLPELLEEGYAVEASGWKSAQGTAITSHPSTRAYYTDVASHASAKGALRLFFLRLDERPISFQYAVVSSDTLYCVKAGYDEAFRAYGPGKLLMHDVIAWAAENHLQRCDLGGSDDSYKLEWTTSSEGLLKYEAWAPNSRGRFEYATQFLARPLMGRGRKGLAGLRRALSSAGE